MLARSLRRRPPTCLAKRRGACKVPTKISGCASARDMTLVSDALKHKLRLLVIREALFFGPERIGMIVATALDQTRRMSDVQHLVIEDVLDKPGWYVLGVERLADDDGFVRGIVMAQYASRASLRPGERRLLYLAVEVAAVKALKHLIQIVDLTSRRRDHFAPATAARDVGG